MTVDKEKPDIIGLAESRAKESIRASKLDLEGYVMFIKDRDNRGEREHSTLASKLFSLAVQGSGALLSSNFEGALYKSP